MTVKNNITPNLKRDILLNSITTIAALLLVYFIPFYLKFNPDIAKFENLTLNIFILVIYIIIAYNLLRTTMEWQQILAYWQVSRKGQPYLRGLPRCPFLITSGTKFSCNGDITPTVEPNPLSKCHSLEEAKPCMLSKAPPLFDLLVTTDNIQMKHKIITFLGKMNYKAAVPQFITWINDESYDVSLKKTIIAALGHLQAEEALEAIVNIIGKHGMMFDQVCFTTLREISSVKSIPILTTYLTKRENQQDYISVLAVKTLEAMASKHPEESISTIKQVLNQNANLDPVIVSYLLTAAEKTGNNDATKEIIAPYLSHDDEILRATAQLILEDIEPSVEEDSTTDN